MHSLAKISQSVTGPKPSQEFIGPGADFVNLSRADSLAGAVVRFGFASSVGV
ncbi:MAG: hypothetical protein AAF989_02960 [Planctomycetota bacterium]